MIKLITDSPSDIPKELREQYNITVMPVPITVDGVTYRETIDFEGEEYYPILLAAKELPTHAQVTMMEFREELDKAAEQQDCDAVIIVTITSKGSGIYDAACLAKKLFFEERPELEGKFTVDVIDSLGYAWAYGHAVVDAAKAIAEGKTREQVLEILNDSLGGYTAVVALTNLDYAKRSGRITAVAAFVGEVLGFRPILELRGGELITKTKVRGDHKLIQEMATQAKALAVEDGRPYYILVADSMDNAKAMKKEIDKRVKLPFGGYYKIGASVATNAGPTIFGFVMPTQRP